MTPAAPVVVDYAPRHAAAWRSLNLAWIERMFAVEPKDLEVLGDPEGHILAKGGRIFIAECDGQPVGCAAILTMADGGYELGKMATLDDAKGRGVGRAIMTACIAAARAAGAHRLYLESNSALIPALALYRSVGFVDLPPRETPYARVDVFMELKL